MTGGVPPLEGKLERLVRRAIEADLRAVHSWAQPGAGGFPHDVLRSLAHGQYLEIFVLVHSDTVLAVASVNDTNRLNFVFRVPSAPKGSGAVLAATVLDRAIARGSSVLCATEAASEQGREMLEKLGFARTSTSTLPWSIDAEKWKMQAARNSVVPLEETISVTAPPADLS